MTRTILLNSKSGGWWVSLVFNSLHMRTGYLLPPITGLPVRFSDKMETKPAKTASKGGGSHSSLLCDWLVTSSWGSLSPPKREGTLRTDI